MKFSYTAIVRWILTTIELQLFLTAFSLPLLIGWGLPLSFATLIGNSIFTPLLAGFLLLSSLLFILELLSIPNGVIILSLEYLTQAWHWLLSIGSPSWLWYAYKPTWLFLIAIPLSALVIVHYRNSLAQMSRIVLFVLIFVVTYIMCSISRPFETHFTIPCGSGELQVIHRNNTTVVIDPHGTLARINASTNWSQFQLIPTLVQQTGKPTIDHLILSKVGLRIFELTHVLFQRSMLNTVHVPYWKSKLSKKAWRAYFELQRSLPPTEYALMRYGNTKNSIFFESPNTYISFSPSSKKSKTEVPMTNLQVWYTVDKQETRLV